MVIDSRNIHQDRFMMRFVLMNYIFLLSMVECPWAEENCVFSAILFTSFDCFDLFTNQM